MKILQLNEKCGLPVELKSFNHLRIHNEKYIPNEFKKEKYPSYMNYSLIKVEDNKLQQFESNPFASSFTQEVSTYTETYNNNDTIFDVYFAMEDINEYVGFTSKITSYSMLIDIFKEMTNHVEGHCTVDDINEIRAYLNNKIVEEKKEVQII